MQIEKVKKGEKYHMLTILSLIKKGKRQYVECLCDCGNITITREYNVRKGLRYSCGCYQRAKATQNKGKLTHGLTYTPEYESWCKMKSRCHNEKNNRYYRYGGRGIKVCDEWVNSFENFYRDMGNKPGKEYSIDRIDNDGDYCPANCRWATPKQQVENQAYRGGMGVSKNGNKYMAQLSRGKVMVYLGTFDDFDTAKRVSDKYKEWYEVNRCNKKIETV